MHPDVILGHLTNLMFLYLNVLCIYKSCACTIILAYGVMVTALKQIGVCVCVRPCVSTMKLQSIVEPAVHVA